MSVLKEYFPGILIVACVTKCVLSFLLLKSANKPCLVHVNKVSHINKSPSLNGSHLFFFFHSCQKACLIDLNMDVSMPALRGCDSLGRRW